MTKVAFKAIWDTFVIEYLQNSPPFGPQMGSLGTAINQMFQKHKLVSLLNEVVSYVTRN